MLISLRYCVDDVEEIHVTRRKIRLDVLMFEKGKNLDFVIMLIRNKI